MQNYSLTYTGIIASALGLIVKVFGLPIGDEEVVQIVALVAQLGGLAVAIYGRYKAGGINVLGVKDK